MNIFHTSRLPTGLKQETLARMVRTLLLRLVDDNLGKQPEGEALLKVGIRQVLEDHFFVTRHTARFHVTSTRNTCDMGVACTCVLTPARCSLQGDRHVMSAWLLSGCSRRLSSAGSLQSSRVLMFRSTHSSTLSQS